MAASGPKVDAIFGLHGWPGLPVGTVATKPAPLLAADRQFHRHLHRQGLSRRLSAPRRRSDRHRVRGGASACSSSSRARPIRPMPASSPSAGSTPAPRSTSSPTPRRSRRPSARSRREQRKRTARSRSSAACAASRRRTTASIEFTWHRRLPLDRSTTRRWPTTSRRSPRQTLGDDRFIPVAKPSMGGEDFSYYLEKVPGCFFLVGVEPAELRGRLPDPAQRLLRLHRRGAGGRHADVPRAGAGDYPPGPAAGPPGPAGT